MASAAEKLALHNAPVRVDWKCNTDGESKRLHVTLDFGLYASRGEAYFKLRVPIGLRGRGKKTNFYFFLRLEHCTSLQLNDKPDAVSPSIKSSFVQSGECSEPDSIVALRWMFTQPGVFIGPQSSIHPKPGKEEKTLALMKSLARANAFTLYLPVRELERSLVQSASTLVVESGLKSTRDEYLFERLYSGKGGFPIDLGSDQLRHDSPPSYDELGPSPPPPPKRPRQGSPSSPTSSKKAKQDQLDHFQHQLSDKPAEKNLHAGQWKADVWQQMLEAQLAALSEEVADVRRRVNDTHVPQASQPVDGTKGRLDQIEKQMELLRNQMEALQESLQHASDERERALERRVERRLELRLEQRFEERFAQAWRDASEALEEHFEQRMEERLDERLDPAIDDVVEETDVRIEERALQIKDDMQSFVREELQNVKEELRDGFDLGNAVLRVEFER
ncbi:hypothetical protein MPH_02904 [Macrophomina phaseolina MS6]|uniref:Uncharacterized protein n=1 Tax=Macrophomina phaseolina (strain MS6) TaxID=1126212 RepID=K2RYI5_MACPH|nr:hypothetical protein MPH_02904 [Macrophomina phaseolina MS6]